MTEEEAKSKVCPVGSVHGSLNSAWDGISCIGSACMAWRWTTVANPDWKPQTAQTFPPTVNVFSQTPQGVPSTTDGYCGLAGRP